MTNRQSTPSDPTGIVPPENSARSFPARSHRLRPKSDEDCQRQIVPIPMHMQTAALRAGDRRVSEEQEFDFGPVDAAPSRNLTGLDNAPASGGTAQSDTVGVVVPTVDTRRCVSDPPVDPVTTSLTYETFLAAAGMPTARFANQPTYDPLRDRERWDADMGRIAHEIIGTLARDCQNRPADQVRILIADALHARRLPGRGDRSYLRLSGLIGAYMHLHLPHSPAILVGREYPLEEGRADLVWHHPARGTFIDEIKTWRRACWEDAADQIARYMRGGTEAFGDFAGVRFVSLGNARASTWITPDGELKPVNLND